MFCGAFVNIPRHSVVRNEQCAVIMDDRCLDDNVGYDKLQPSVFVVDARGFQRRVQFAHTQQPQSRCGMKSDKCKRLFSSVRYSNVSRGARASAEESDLLAVRRACILPRPVDVFSLDENSSPATASLRRLIDAGQPRVSVT